MKFSLVCVFVCVCVEYFECVLLERYESGWGMCNQCEWLLSCGCVCNKVKVADQLSAPAISESRGPTHISHAAGLSDIPHTHSSALNLRAARIKWTPSLWRYHHSKLMCYSLCILSLSTSLSLPLSLPLSLSLSLIHSISVYVNLSRRQTCVMRHFG